MKLLGLAAAAASAGLVAAAPKGYKVSTLGGATFSVPQVYNDHYSQIGKGPRALAKIYQKYGMEMPAGLVSTLDVISKKIAAKYGADLAARAAANDTAGTGKGLSFPPTP